MLETGGGVSVIIPAYEAPQLHATLASLAAPGDAGRVMEIIVVGPSRCCDEDHAPVVRFLPTPARVTAPVARNIGIRSAAGGWLAFIDADCIAAPDWLSGLLRPSASGRRVVGGGVAFGKTSYWGEVHNVSMLHDYHVSAPPGPRRFLPTLNLLVQRDVVARVGLMNEEMRRAQDLEWTARMVAAGIELWFEPGAAVIHRPGRGARSLWRDYYDTGRTSYSTRQAFGLPLPFPRWARSRDVLRLLSPIIATAAALKCYERPALVQYTTCLPGVWYTKLAWCLGASTACGSVP